MSLCRVQQLRQHSTFDCRARCQERLFQGRRRFVLRNHTQIFCLHTRRKAHASVICTCKHALACPCKDERSVMSLPDLVRHTFSQKRKLVFLCFLRVIHQKHETSASAVQIGSGALKQMAETEAIRQASIIQALRQCSKSICSIPQKACAVNLYCLPSFIFCNPCQTPQKRGPARAKRSGQTHETARSSGPFADSIEEVLSYGRSLSVEGRKTSVCCLFWNRTVFTMAQPSFGSRCPESAEFSRHGRKSPAAQSLQGMERVRQDQPGKPRRHHADACTILGHVGQKKRHMQVSSLTERLCRSQTGSALPHPDLQAPGLMCAISPKASFPPAVSVARYRQIAWPQASPSSAWCRFPICACFLASLKRRICCIYTDRHCQPMLRFDICACPSPVMISCSE
jgi:hypothetical protein